MIGICPKCGNYDWNKEISQDGSKIICQSCGHRWPFKRLPLFIITGASGVGKTTGLQELMQHETDYIVMDSDIFCFMPHGTAEEMKFKRETLLNVSKNVMQVGKPLVWSASSLPDQFEDTYNRRFFSNIYYLALVCDAQKLEQRMRKGRHIDDENWIKGSADFNNWFMKNGPSYKYPIEVCDISELSIKEYAKFIDEWIMSKIHNENYLIRSVI